MRSHDEHRRAQRINNINYLYLKRDSYGDSSLVRRHTIEPSRGDAKPRQCRRHRKLNNLLGLWSQRRPRPSNPPRTLSILGADLAAYWLARRQRDVRTTVPTERSTQTISDPTGQIRVACSASSSFFVRILRWNIKEVRIQLRWSVFRQRAELSDASPM